MRKLPKAFSYSGYLSERWIHPLWAIKPIDTWLDYLNLMARGPCLTDISALHPECIIGEWFYDTAAFQVGTVLSTNMGRLFT